MEFARGMHGIASCGRLIDRLFVPKRQRHATDSYVALVKTETVCRKDLESRGDS
jgi:hypothetical protein